LWGGGAVKTGVLGGGVWRRGREKNTKTLPETGAKYGRAGPLPWGKKPAISREGGSCGPPHTTP